MKPLLFEHNDTFWYETYRVLGHAAYGGADIRAALATARLAARVLDRLDDVFAAR